MRLLVSLALAFSLGTGIAHGQTRSNVLYAGDPRGEPEVTICSQNLENYGQYADARLKSPDLTPELFKRKEDSLVTRFVKADCDVIAVQELLGRNEIEGKAALEQLALAIKKRTGRIFEARVGPSNDRLLRLGYLIATDRVTVKNQVSYVEVELPRISKNQKPRMFPRGPLEVQLEVKPREQFGFNKIITLINIHFKSKSGRQSDPTALEWEPYRIEMAEALRRIMEKRHSKALSEGHYPLIILGDRNAHLDAACAKVLEGLLTLKHFQEGGACRLSKRGVPLCQAGTASTQRLFSVITADPQTGKQPGTYLYNNIYSWLDDILISQEALRFAGAVSDQTGDYDSGVIYEPKLASDHALVYVRLNW